MIISTSVATLFGAIGGATQGVVIAAFSSAPQKGRIVKWLAAERALAAAIQTIFCEINPFDMTLLRRGMVGLVVGHIAAYQFIREVTDNSFPEFVTVVKIAFAIDFVYELIMLSALESLQRKNKPD